MEYGFWSVNRAGQPVAVPPFALAFSTVALGGHALAAADEEGVVSVLDTRRSLVDQTHGTTRNAAPLSRFVAHDNAIFDVIWMPGDREVATASGDGTVRVFDIDTMYRRALLRGHSGSAKAIRSLPGMPNVLLSTGRDGNVRAFDLRAPSVTDHDSREQYHAPVFTIDQPHAPSPSVSCGSNGARKRRRVAAPKPRGGHGASVTSLAFHPLCPETLYTAGAADGCVKQWDLRALGGKQREAAPSARCVAKVTPCTESRAGGIAGARRTHGVAHIDVDASGRSLLVAATDSRIYLYSAGNLRLRHARVLAGHTATSFYIRARFSPDGSHVVSGSADARAYVWDVNAPCVGGAVHPMLALDGHAGGEASAVDWCRSDPLKIATCADDATARVWTCSPERTPAPADAEGDECTARYVPPPALREHTPAAAQQATLRSRTADIRDYLRKPKHNNAH